MNKLDDPTVVVSDESLVLLARAGDKGAFAELWQRHARSGVRVARQFTSSSDADDLVSEAYVRIYQRVLGGGGPDGAFRPYLYTTIRNLAARWGQSDRSVNVDDIGEFEVVVEGDDPATVALDRTLTARAFRSLPDRWQTVLWYTEVEGMDPHEVAPMLGISANGVAALAYRAREGLRKAWLQAHVSDATSTGDCRWTIERLGDHARNGLTARERDRVHEHLGTCAKCSIISEEVDEVGSRLALVMIPLILGGTAGGLFLASLSAPSGALAAELAASSMPPAFNTLASAGALTAPAVTSGLVATSVATPLVSALAVALVVSGGLAMTAVATQHSPASVSQSATEATGAADSTTATALPSQLSPATIPWLIDAVSTPVDPSLGALGSVGATVDGAVGGVTGTVNGITGGTISPGPVAAVSAPPTAVSSTAVLDLTGSGMPGATVTVQVGGIVYGTTEVAAQGTWAVHISALPAGSGPVQLKQVLVSALGVDLVSVPLRVLSNSLDMAVSILGS